MKVVLNRCFGGFGLSPKAYKRIAELTGVECYFFTGVHSDKKCTLEDAEKTSFFSVYNIPNPQDYKYEDWSAMSHEEKDTWNKQYRERRIDDFRDDRTNPLLIRVVEELGSDIASGQLSELEVVEIPDGIDWEIDDYDGRETIEEKHRSW